MEIIRQRLREKRGMLTKSEVRTAEWLEPNLERLAFLTVNEVSRQAGVSEATIVRFSRKLGFESYTDMQRAAQETIQRHFSLGDRLESALGDGDGVLNAAYRRDLENLRQTYEYLDQAAFDESVGAICKAEKVLVTGLRASSAVSAYLTFCLRLLRPGVHMLHHEWDDVQEQLIDLRPGSVLIAVSRGRPARRTIEIVAEARDRHKVRVVALTGSSVSALAEHANHVLVASGEDGFTNYTAMFSLAGALVEGVAKEMRGDATARLRLLDEINGAEVYGRPLPRSD